MAIRIIIFEDNAELRKSLGLLFSLDTRFELKGSFQDCNNVSEIVSVLQPDLVLMDIDLPGMNGIEAVRQIKSMNKSCKILMHTVFEDAEKLFSAIKNGANGYILKKAGPEKLKEACLDAMEGGAPITPGMASLILAEFVPKTNTETYNLTQKEQCVLSFLVEGLSYKMIADKMTISIDTVRSHIKKIYEKLHVHSMSEAVAKALRDKII